MTNEEQTIANLKKLRSFHNGSYGADINRAIKALEQEPKPGHWISPGAMPSDLGNYRWCSNCGCGIDIDEFHRNHYNFCPNCGADMRGGGGETWS